MLWAQEPAKAFPWESEQIQEQALALQSEEEWDNLLEE